MDSIVSEAIAVLESCGYQEELVALIKSLDN